jgi:hypothetical protein
VKLLFTRGFQIIVAQIAGMVNVTFPPRRSGATAAQAAARASPHNARIARPHDCGRRRRGLVPQAAGQVGVSVIWNTWLEAPVARKVLPDVLDTVE